MLYIRYKNENGYWAQTQYCDSIGLQSLTSEYVQQVVFIRADGHEALEIQRKFTHAGRQEITIPWNWFSAGQSQTWYGDIAKTILANL